MAKKPRMFCAEEADVFGMAGALILNQARWAARNRYKKEVIEGITYTPISIAQWVEMVPMFSRATIVRNLTKLKDLRVLLQRQDLGKNRTDRTCWYAVDDEQIHLLKMSTSICSKRAHPCAQNEQIFSIEENKKENGSKHAADAAGAALAAIHPSEEVLAMGNGKSAAEIFADLKEKQGKMPDLPKPTSTNLARFWRRACSLTYSDMEVFKPPTGMELGQWKYLIKTVGAELPAMVQDLIRNWTDFCYTVKAHAGLSSTPTRPQVAFLVLHIATGMNWYHLRQTHKLLKSKVDCLPVHSSAPEVTVEEEVVYVTLEEAKALLKKGG